MGPTRSVVYTEMLIAVRAAWWAEMEVAAQSRVEALDGDATLLLARFRQGVQTEQERELLKELLVSDKLKFGGQKRLQPQHQDAMIRWALRVWRADQRSGKADPKWRSTKAIVNHVATHYRVPKTRVFDLLKEVDAPRRLVVSPRTAGVHSSRQ